jgi:hypothetical protein
MIDMKTRASVELGDSTQFLIFLQKTMGIPAGQGYLADGTDVGGLFRFLFPFARLVTFDNGGRYAYYAVFRCEEDAVEFKLKYL